MHAIQQILYLCEFVQNQGKFPEIYGSAKAGWVSYFS